ncbi:MAG: MFS transporter, partial [Acidobacteriota bacterium]
GKWTGLQTCVGNLAGVVVGPLTGWIVDRTGHFALAFSLCAGVAVFGGICWVVVVGQLEQTDWLKPPALATVASEAT